ncbi:MAG TPA: hypothetical protein VM432_13685, partial [Bdellovibrionales bacterium]|nr:hypothetical protein [Bdellovibrionales bacterium]
SWITNELISEKICLWTVSSNTPGVLRHELVEDSSPGGNSERRLVFRLGKAEDTRLFRQEIALELLTDGSIEYRYAWGVPHQNLEPRTRALLKRNK